MYSLTQMESPVKTVYMAHKKGKQRVSFFREGSRVKFGSKMTTDRMKSSLVLKQ